MDRGLSKKSPNTTSLFLSRGWVGAVGLLALLLACSQDGTEGDADADSDDGDGDADSDDDDDVDADSESDGDAEVEIDGDVDGDSDPDPDGDVEVEEDADLPCTPESCDDGLFCNGVELCTELGRVGGTEPILTDDVDCTLDDCTEEDGVTHRPYDALCFDFDDCTVAERCDPSVGCQWEGLDADEDGFIASSCGGDDCDDDDEVINPVGVELCDDVDDDCDGVVDDDCESCLSLEREGSDYLFCVVHITWLEARADCQSGGYDLVVIQDAPEDAWLVEQVTLLVPDSDWWIGITDSEVERTYLWVDGTVAWEGGAPVGYTNFNGGAPEGLNNQDCAELDAASMFRWDEASCWPTQPYICERAAG